MLNVQPATAKESYSCGSSGLRYLNFFASARQAASGFMPAVQLGSESDAAAAHTPASRQRLSSQPSCRPSNTPAQNASPAPAVPAMYLSGNCSEDCQTSSPLRVPAKPPSGK